MLIERCVLIHSLHFRDEQISGFHHQLWQCISLHNITCIHFGCTKMRRNHAIRSHLSALYTLQSASLLYYTSAHTHKHQRTQIYYWPDPPTINPTPLRILNVHTHHFKVSHYKIISCDSGKIPENVGKLNRVIEYRIRE